MTRRYLVFVRSDGSEWTLHGEAEGGLSVAVNLANLIVAKGKASRAQVFEVSGRNGVPTFIYRHGVKHDV